VGDYEKDAMRSEMRVGVTGLKKEVRKLVTKLD